MIPVSDSEKAMRFDDICKLIAVRTQRLKEINQIDKQLSALMLFDPDRHEMPVGELAKEESKE